MNVRETLEAVGARLQVAWIVGSVPTEGGGDVRVLYANTAAAALFGYPSPALLVGVDVRRLMPDDIGARHREIVGSYVERANGGTVSTTSILGSWRELEGRRRDGSPVQLRGNVADVRNSEERFFVAIFSDRTSEVEREAALASALRVAETAKADAERLQAEADEARKLAEDGLLRQRRLSGQITLLRQIFGGTVGLVVMLGVLVVAQWVAGITDPDGLAMVERVLLVLTGILGSAMASVFDSRNRAD